jgi:8-oxo-dGTP pyrophosphatase MutT (NUDIX family)
MRPIRNSAKAIIIEQGKLLAIQNRDAAGDWYILPGGGQHPGETLVEALKRECLEEVNVAVVVGDLCLVREYIGSHHEFAEHDAAVHEIEFMFNCTLAPGAVPGIGTEPDSAQTGFAWLDLAHLERWRLYPAILRTLLPQRANPPHPVYLGDVN